MQNEKCEYLENHKRYCSASEIRHPSEVRHLHFMAILKSFSCKFPAYMYTLLLKALFHLFKYEYCLSLSIFTADDELHWGDKIHWLTSRAISSEFLTPRVLQEYPMEREKISIFATFGGHLGFYRKIKKCEYLKNRKK